MDLLQRRREIGNKIRELREREGWNQAKLAVELAKVLGKTEPIASATISRYEEGKRSVRSETLEALGAIFKVKSSFFYDRENRVSEARAAYATGTNTKRLAVIEEIPLGFPEYEDRDISGFAEFPRFLFPGAEFIIKVGDSFSCGGLISEGDYIFVSPDNGEKSGDRFFYKLEGIFFVGRLPKKPAHPEILGEVIGILKK